MKNSFFDFKIIAAPEPLDPEILFAGKGGRGLGILIRESEHLPEMTGLLRNILLAIHLHLEEDALLILLPADKEVQLGPLLRQHNLNALLLFGIDPKDCGIHFPLPLNQPTLHQDITYLASSSLAAMQQERQEGGKALRGALWQALQQAFPKS